MLSPACYTPTQQKKVNDAKFRAFQKLGILYQNDTVRHLHTFAGFCISGSVFTEGAKFDKIFTYLLFGGDLFSSNIKPPQFEVAKQ